uniref:Uncharacterized protein n=1 Tax=Aegilops tauschii subsp. strangulata TaxID=200361 RepID=A0A453F0C7_AEGTS
KKNPTKINQRKKPRARPAGCPRARTTLAALALHPFSAALALASRIEASECPRSLHYLRSAPPIRSPRHRSLRRRRYRRYYPLQEPPPIPFRSRRRSP